jgi:hypothetical protein
LVGRSVGPSVPISLQKLVTSRLKRRGEEKRRRKRKTGYVAIPSRLGIK